MFIHEPAPIKAASSGHGGGMNLEDVQKRSIELRVRFPEAAPVLLCV